MFKKLLVATAILAASSSVALAAGGAPAPYVAGSVGLVDNTARATATVDGTTFHSTTLGYRGLDATLAAGYGGIVSPNIYLAGELSVIPGTLSVSTGNTVKTSWGVGLSILPGIMLSDKTMGYARLGVVESEFTNPSQARVGGQAGVGIQTNLCQNWDLRGEYDYSKYSSPANLVSPTQDAFNLGIVYKFE